MTRRALVTLHYPLDAHCVAEILRAVARAYPDARLGEDGTIWDETPVEPVDAARAAERVVARRDARRAAL